MYNLDKYKFIAGGNPQGMKLRKLVDDKYADWLTIVEDAPWLRNWLKSPLFGCEDASPTPCYTPYGRIVGGGSKFVHNKIADAIYASAVWGFGMDNWSSQSAMTTIAQLQGLKTPNALRQYMYDTELRNSCGIRMPYELGVLDRWLEALWRQTRISSK